MTHFGPKAGQRERSQDGVSLGASFGFLTFVLFKAYSDN